MNTAQEMFKNFIIENTEPEYGNEVNELLKESFLKQSNGTFSLEYILEFKEKLLKYVKKDSFDLVNKTIEDFKNRTFNC